MGAPIHGSGSGLHRYLHVSATGVTVAYRKCFLGGEEPAHFVPGNGPVVIEVDGWRVGLGSPRTRASSSTSRELPRSMSTSVSPAWFASRPSWRSKNSERRRIAQACNSYVGFASFAGATGGGLDSTAGISSLWSPAGSAIARAGAGAGDFARATLV